MSVRRLALGLVPASCVLVGVLMLAAVPVFALNPERHYEMVSPLYKGGYGVKEIKAAEPAGESIAYTSVGGFAGSPSGGEAATHDYLARRTPTGWLTTSLEPTFGGLQDISANFEYALASGGLGPNVGVISHTSTEFVFQLHHVDAPNTAASWEVFGGRVLKQLEGGQTAAEEEGASADLCHVVLGRTGVGSVPGALVPEAEGVPRPIYDLSRGCDGEPPSLRLVGLTNSPTPTPITRICPVELGTGLEIEGFAGKEQNDAFNAVSGDGSEMFFTADARNEESSCPLGARRGVQLFVRLGGSRTVEVSRPLEVGKPFGGCVGNRIAGEVPCEGATTRATAAFKGASEDGSKVFFTTSAPLLGGSEEAGSNLYMATIGCPAVDGAACAPAQREVTSLVQLSRSAVAKEAAEVQGVVSLAPDGSHIYYLARGVLSSGANEQGQAPLAGADNLYVYDTLTGSTRFIAELCSGPLRSGAAEDTHCPAEGDSDAEILWGSNAPEAQTTRNGAFLVFCSYAQLLPGDADSAKDVYRYDAETGALERVSVGENSYDANGNDNAFDANIKVATSFGGPVRVYSQYEMATRAVSEDGSRVVFETAEPLSPAATNGKVNIYEWHEGSVSLVSSGTSEENDSWATITASGRDIFFTTSQGLVAQDTDGRADLYDARLGEGFAAVPAERQRCSGDTCQGPLTDPAPLLVPGSVSQAPGGNFTTSAPRPLSKVKKARPSRKTKKKNKKRKRSEKAGKASRAIGGSER
jgi:hypothetical protein